MREKIAEIINQLFTREQQSMEVAVDKILSLLPSLDGIVVEEECGHLNYVIGEGSIVSQCPDCKSIGTITRQAEWGDVPIREILEIIQKMKDYPATNYVPTLIRLVGRLSVKE